MRLSCHVLCFAVFLLTSRVAFASGFDAARFGGELGGHAAAGTPFAVYYNPAALALTKRVHLAVDLTLALHGQTFKRSASDVPEPDDAQGANTGRAKLFNVLGGPALAASFRLEDFAFGAGISAPFAGIARFRGNDTFKGK